MTLANEAEPLFNEYLAVRSELNEVLAGYAARLVEKIGNYRAKQKEYAATFQQLEPEITNLNQIKPENKLLYSQINKELEAIGLRPNAVEMATAQTFSVPDLEFGYSVTATVEILLNRLAREAAAIEKKQFNERRMQIFETLPSARMPESEKVLEYRAS